MANQLKQVFDGTLKKIGDSFTNEAKSIFKEEKEKFLATTPAKALQDEIISLKEFRDSTNEKIKKLEYKLESTDEKVGDLRENHRNGKLDDNLHNILIFASTLEYNRYNTSDLYAAKQTLKTKAGKNLSAWKAIQEKFTHMFNLAITPKQQQMVVMQLQSSVDWNSLGIDVPTMFKVDKIEIKNGLLVLDNALPDLS